MERAVEQAKRSTELFWELGRKYAREFEYDNLNFTHVLINIRGCRKMMVWIYCLLIGYEKVKRLEDLSRGEKEEMWAFIKDVVGDKRNDTELCKDMMRAFYALEYFLNEQK